MTEYLLGAGASKCGTTLLYDLLEKHPALSVADRKELCYFDNVVSPNPQEKVRVPDKREYDALFLHPERIKLDVTPEYMMRPEYMKAIVDTLGADQVKLVIMLRDPIERARSNYNMVKWQMSETLPIEECFERERERMAKNMHDYRLYSYFVRGLYASQLDHVYEYVKKENVRVYVFEDFVKNQQAYIDDVCDFVGIARITVRDKHSNKGVFNVRVKWLGDLIQILSRKVPKKYKIRGLRKVKHFITKVNEKPVEREMLPKAFHDQLVSYYEDDVKRLHSQYGVDTSLWKNFT